MRSKKLVWLAVLLLAILGAGGLRACQTAAADREVNYEREMIKLIADMNTYARARNPQFGLLTNGGTGLFVADEYHDAADVAQLTDAIEGALAESIFYGYDMTDGARTPAAETRDFVHNFAPVEAAGRPVFSLDYVAGDAQQIADSYKKADQMNYIGLAATARGLDVMPTAAPHNANGASVTSLKDAKNYFILLNPGAFTRAEYLAHLAATDYDVLIIDPYCEDMVLAPAEVASLQRKPNGVRRLVYAYLSVGEAEEYRLYWQPLWEKKRPAWLDVANENWEGDYKVKYWHSDWQRILYGTADSELDQIIAAGFDGAFLDVIDAYYYYRSRKN